LPALLGLSASSWAAPDAAVWASVQQQKQPLLSTLRELVAIESGSGDREGLDRISQVIFEQLKALGGQVQFIDANAQAYRMQDTPAHIGRMVKATFKGHGDKNILLLAHMDTVYLKGMGAKQPYRVEGNKAYGLGIGDDKAQHRRHLAHTGHAASDQLQRLRPNHRADQRRRRDQLASLASNHHAIGPSTRLDHVL
jgi:glutamate carboxypeptidase